MIESILLLITLLLAIGSVVGKTRSDDGKPIFWPNWYGWIVIVLVVLSGLLNFEQININSIASKTKDKKISSLADELIIANQQLIEAKSERDTLKRINELTLLSTRQKGFSLEFYLPVKLTTGKEFKPGTHILDLLFEDLEIIGPKGKNKLLFAIEIISKNQKIKLSFWSFTKTPYDLSTIGYAKLTQTGTETELGFSGYVKAISIDGQAYLKIVADVSGEFQANQWMSELSPKTSILKLSYMIDRDFKDRKGLMSRLEKLYIKTNSAFLNLPILNQEGLYLKYPLEVGDPEIEGESVIITTRIMSKPEFIMP